MATSCGWSACCPCQTGGGEAQLVIVRRLRLDGGALVGDYEVWLDGAAPPCRFGIEMAANLLAGKPRTAGSK